jgi:hypothetical protein
MYFEDHLEEDDIARLLGVPEPFVVETIRGLTGKAIRGLDRVGVRRLFAER